MRKRTYRTLTSLTILSLLGQPIVGLAPHLVNAETVDQNISTETVNEKVNLALNKPVTYTSQYDGGGIGPSAVDGDSSTFWRKKTSDNEAKLMVDLGEQHEIDEIEVLLYINKDSGAMNQFSIEYSSDLLTWETVAVQTENLKDKEGFTFPVDAEARYVRFSQDSADQAKHGVYELRVLGDAPAVPEEPVDDRTNIAQGKTVTASTDYDAVRAAHVLDNDLTTYWRNVARDENPAITLDLGEKHQVDEVELVLYLVGRNMHSYTLEYSADGNNWEQVVTETENLVDGEVHTVAVDAEAQYLRFSHYSPNADGSSGSSANGLYEFRVFGSVLESEEEPPSENPEVELGRNLALGQPTEHSTQWGSGGPSRSAVDGDPATFWRNLSSDGMTPFMIVDLGPDAVFNQIDLQLYVRHAMNNFKLEYSNDKEIWYTLAEESGADQLVDGTEFSYNVKDAIGEDYIHARYVRFTHELGAAGNVNGLYEIEVYEANVDVESVTISRNDFSLLQDTELQLRADVAPLFLEQSVIWTSSDPSIATVDENGTVRGVGVGEAVITATSTKTNTQFDQVTVTVLAESLSDKELLTFDIGDNIGEINQETGVITVEVPFETNLASVTPSFTTNGISVGLNGQTVTSGETAIDLSRPITLEVMGEDGIINRYLVELIIQSSGQDLAFGKSITTDHYRADNPPELAVDGNPNTQFKSDMPMYNDGDLDSYLELDLGHKHVFDRVSMDLYNHFNIQEYRIQVSNDGEEWTTVFEKIANLSPGDENTEGDFDQYEEAEFEPVTARYVRWEQLLVNDGDSLVGGMNDFAIYNGEKNPIVDKAVLIIDGEREVLPKEDIELPLGESLTLSVRGILSNGEEVVLPAESIQLTARTRDGGPFLTLGEDNTVTATDYGITRLTAHITHEGRTRSFDFFVDTYDYETVMMDTAMEIADSTALIGYPSVVNNGAAAPTLKVRPYFDGTLRVDVTHNGSSVFTNSQDVTGLEDVSLPLTVATNQNGLYTVTVTLDREGKAPHVETFYFTVVDGNTKRANETYLAYTGPDGKLVYTPDFRGNTLIDYSHAGYKGANEAVPEVADILTADRIKLVDPIEGDNTAHIQAAIDEVGSWELNDEGFRGVVQLAPGQFDIAGTLNLNKSGVILRGAGDGEGGTLLWDIGDKRNYLLNVGGGQTTETGVRSSITDAYVPTGGRTFTVADASQFAVGDNIFVNRHSNERWIHEIYMDDIPERAGTVQWAPFDLKFDRKIVAIDGNTITIDAPINNAIEQRWGGGTIVKYEDSRVENVGVEGLLVDVDVNWEDANHVKTDRFGNRYSTDENQIRSFMDLRNVKNAWVEDVTGYHLIYALVNVANTSKWITVQNSNVYEMNGVISGGTRYAFNTDGQMVLIRDTHVTTARHSFTIQARVAGPNVYLDSLAEQEMTNSEPHQRYSVGGLYDNIHGTVNIQDRGNMGTGHGWAGANYVAWNTQGYIRVEAPPTAMNYAIGAVGNANRTDKDGYWESFGEHVRQRSLYYHQLADRLGVNIGDVDSKAPPVVVEPDVVATLSGNDSVKVNKNYVLTYGIDSTENFQKQVVTVTYDATKFALNQIKGVHGYSKVNHIDTSVPGVVTFEIENKRQNASIKNQDKLVDITFKALSKGNAEFTVEEGSLTHKNGEELLGSAAKKAVEVK